MKYFKYSEFFRSETAEKYNKKHPDMRIPLQPTDPLEQAQVNTNVSRLVDNVLDIAREALGKPVYVTSGWRHPRLNKLIHGSKTSQHMTGQAADIMALNPDDNLKLAHDIALWTSFDQLILEDRQRNKYQFAWVHVSYVSEVRNRKRILMSDERGNLLAISYGELNRLFEERFFPQDAEYEDKEKS